MEDKLVNAVVAIAATLKKLDEQGLYTLTPVQMSEALSALHKIATALDEIEAHLRAIEGHLVGLP